MDTGNVAFDEGLNKLIEAAKNNKNVIEYDQISSYFGDMVLNEEIYDRIFEELESRKIDVLRIIEDDIDIVPV